jgi:hypothetical protein
VAPRFVALRCDHGHVDHGDDGTIGVSGDRGGGRSNIARGLHGEQRRLGASALRHRDTESTPARIECGLERLACFDPAAAGSALPQRGIEQFGNGHSTVLARATTGHDDWLAALVDVEDQ